MAGGSGGDNLEAGTQRFKVDGNAALLTMDLNHQRECFAAIDLAAIEPRLNTRLTLCPCCVEQAQPNNEHSAHPLFHARPHGVTLLCVVIVIPVILAPLGSGASFKHTATRFELELALQQFARVVLNTAQELLQRFLVFLELGVVGALAVLGLIGFLWLLLGGIRFLILGLLLLFLFLLLLFLLLLT